MLSTELKKDVQKLWNAFWAGGIANPLTAIEQITYLIFLKQLEDLDKFPEFFARRDGEDGELYKWSKIAQMSSEEARLHLKNNVFERMRTLGGDGDDNPMRGAELLINSPNLLDTAIQIIN